MKLTAHPMMVAVALGLLGPAALERSSEEAARRLDRQERERVEQAWIEERDAFDREREQDR